jgi:DNA-directed RNA polymerase specialized sigma24 family protein
MHTMQTEIERLPDLYRVVVVLRDLEGRTHEQAARHLSCPVGTVKSRLAHQPTELGKTIAIQDSLAGQLAGYGKTRS